MYINGQTGAVQERVAVHKRCPPFWTVSAPCGHAVAGSVTGCVPQTRPMTDLRTGPVACTM
ncbi:unnamed protein product [Staurois parvus]|uniref:Uncharacterized protein n=1 Tax=Staurois parvus TaxID=386267 RepID=A0ABN9GJ17_9NEOB|nr:unnamed protein product [Staurois parvus]